jgi:Asp-tRNA(Asn)/Glu-tRNA(Gln) amidotransferase A subunit family amidase
LEVANRVLKSIDQGERTTPPLNAFTVVLRDELLREAESSTARYSKQQTVGKLDGVVIAVKDELDLAGRPTTLGSNFPDLKLPTEDSTVVKRLRAAGALIVGKTGMHEIGLGVTGLNLRHGTPRNPYSPDRYTGGSSSGSASAVAAGLCPAAVAADGGGSIRIPAAFCGLFGLKPTYGRVSEFGAFPLCWSVAHIGPIAASAADLSALYDVIAGPDPFDPISMGQPPVLLANPNQKDLAGIKLGIYWPWFNDAEPAIVFRCSELVQKFQDRGAEIIEIEIPDLEAARLAHAVTITSEMAQAMERFGPAQRNRMGLDVRLQLALARNYTASDYIQAQRVRARIYKRFMHAFAQVDIIITPTTAILPPMIRPQVRLRSECDLQAMTEIMRFVTPANLAGLPAISVPAGFTSDGVPVGLQGIARPWHEHSLLRLAFASESLVKRPRPPFSFDCL